MAQKTVLPTFTIEFVNNSLLTNNFEKSKSTFTFSNRIEKDGNTSGEIRNLLKRLILTFFKKCALKRKIKVNKIFFVIRRKPIPHHQI